MKTKLVLWGNNAQDERVLIALELRPKDNKINVYEFPETVADEAFSQKMMKEWRLGQPLEFPENHKLQERELTMTESILPEDLKVDRSDLIQRAQAEWHFVVLSSKLSEAYHAELAEIRDRIDRLDDFDDEIWSSLKTFWNKVQSQAKEHNLFREHADDLRDKTNALFARMKELRSKLDEKFKESSRENLFRFMERLGEIEQKIADGLRLQNIFEELKDVQRNFRQADFTREHRSKVWDRIDAAFKVVKEKRFGGSAGRDSNSPLERLQRRYDGLMSAMGKMKRSIERDEEELGFQNRRIERTDGQLEAQIRQAKIVMIQERIRSKEEKLADMVNTKGELEKRLETLRVKEEKRKEKEKLEEAKRKAQEKIAEEIKAAAESRTVSEEELEKAAEAIGSTQIKKSDSVSTAVPAVADEASSQASDESAAKKEATNDEKSPTAEEPATEQEPIADEASGVDEPALATVAANTTDDNTITPAETEEEAAAATPEEPVAEAAPTEDSLLEAVSTTLGETVEDAVDTFKAVAKVVGGHIGEALENVKDKIEEVVEGASEAASDETQGAVDQTEEE